MTEMEHKRSLPDQLASEAKAAGLGEGKPRGADL
jgi:hypothetical protein